MYPEQAASKTRSPRVSWSSYWFCGTSITFAFNLRSLDGCPHIFVHGHVASTTLPYNWPTFALHSVFHFYAIPGWQKLCEGRKGLHQKVWTGTKILSPNIRYIVALLWFVAIYALFGRLWAKKSPFGSKTYCILYWIVIANLWLRAKTTAFVA